MTERIHLPISTEDLKTALHEGIHQGLAALKTARWPVAPSVTEGPEFIFKIATEDITMNARDAISTALAARGIAIQIKVAGLDTEDFMRRGGPVCWKHDHDQVIGRTRSLYRNPQGHLEATMRFGTTPLAANLRQNLERDGRLAASLGVVARDQTVDEARKCLVVHTSELIEWSVVVVGADAGTTSLGQVILYVRG